MSAPRVAVLGAGWAGLAAAIGLVEAGLDTTVLEAARHVGGRARTLAASRSGLRLDNGQHILIGAYQESLRLMRRVGVDPESVLQRRPLELRFSDGLGLAFPALPAPWDAVVGIARARGWRWSDKLALLRTAGAWRLQGFRCAQDWSVARLCAHLPARLQREFIAPLCVSALNTDTHEASAQVFLRVLRDSLLGVRGGSNLLLPRTDMGGCFADPAARWLNAQGALLHTGVRVQHIARSRTRQGGWDVDGQPFDALILACSSTEAVRLLQNLPTPQPTAWMAQAQALRFIPITTVYLHVPGAQGPLLPRPMLALRPQPGAPAQFAFDRSQLGGPAGLLALVVSASEGTHAQVQAQVLAQVHAELGLHQAQALQTVVEKRATFACTPALQRPGMALLPRLWAAGDYIAGPYPATLEGAVLSGSAAARAAVAALQVSHAKPGSCPLQSGGSSYEC